MCMEDGGEEDPPEAAAVAVGAVEVEAGLQDHHQAQAQVALSNPIEHCNVNI